MRIECKYISPQLLKLEAEINEKARMVNCLSNQLLDQMNKIRSKKEKYISDIEQEKILKKIVELGENNVKKLTDDIFSKIEDLKSLGFFQILKKRKETLKLLALQSMLCKEKEALDKNKDELLKVQDYITTFSEHMEMDVYPNFKYHLRRFGFALRDYNRVRVEIENKTGIKLDKVEYSDVIEFVDNGDIKVKQINDIDKISFVKPYKQFEII